MIKNNLVYFELELTEIKLGKSSINVERTKIRKRSRLLLYVLTYGNIDTCMNTVDEQNRNNESSDNMTCLQKNSRGTLFTECCPVFAPIAQKLRRWLTNKHNSNLFFVFLDLARHFQMDENNEQGNGY